MAAQKLPLVLSFRKAKNPLHSVHLGERIQTLRLSRGLTRMQLARLSGVSREHLWLAESRNHKPGLAFLEKVSSGLGIGLNHLLAESDIGILAADDFIQEVIPFLPNLKKSPTAQRHILKVLQAAPRRAK